MKKKNFKKIKSSYCLIVPPLLAAAVILVAFIKEGVVPFGKTSVMYYDMAQSAAPSFYHIWDALHKGDVAMRFNWYTGLGTENFNFSFSFFWIVLLFIKRSMIKSAVSFYVIISFALSAFTSALFLKKETKSGQFVISCLSLCYAFCGYSVMYYTNIWQDNVLLFPIVMLCLARAARGKSLVPLIASLVLYIICGYYIFALTALDLFFIVFLYLVFKVQKEDRKRASLGIFAAMLASAGISAVILLPQLHQMLTSTRFVEKTGFDFSNILSTYSGIIKNAAGTDYNKWIMFFTLAFPAALAFLGMIKNWKKGKNSIFFFICSGLLMTIPVFCEGTNLLLHFGSYRHFPMRTGFILSFIAVWAAAELTENLSFNKIEISKKSVPSIIVSLVFFCVMFLAVYYGIRKLDAGLGFPYPYLVAMPALFIVYLILATGKVKFLDFRASLSLLLAELTVLCVIYIPYHDSPKHDLESSPAYISKTEELRSSLNIEESKTKRIKTIGTTLNNNYGTIMDRATVGDWTHLIPQNVQPSLKALGYSTSYTRIHDSGGTAFSDALLGVTNVLSVKEESSELYDLIDNKDGYNYYSCKYTIPYTIVTNGFDKSLSGTQKNWIDAQNSIYKSLSGDSGDIITKSDYALEREDGNNEYYTFTSKKGEIAYFELKGAKKVKIYVNGEQVRVPSVERPNYAKYPGRFNRSLICLGDLGDGKVEVRLEFTNGKFEEKKNFRKNSSGSGAEKNQNYSSQISLLNLEKLGKVCSLLTQKAEGAQVEAKNYSLDISGVSSSGGETLILPLQYGYDGGWSAKVNGKKAKLSPFAGVLTAVKLEKGKNKISLKYTPPLLKEGAAVSVIFLLLTALCIVLKKKKNFKLTHLSKIAYALYCAGFAAAFAAVYALPCVYALVHSIMKITGS